VDIADRLDPCTTHFHTHDKKRAHVAGSVCSWRMMLVICPQQWRKKNGSNTILLVEEMLMHWMVAPVGVPLDYENKGCQWRCG